MENNLHNDQNIKDWSTFTKRLTEETLLWLSGTDGSEGLEAVDQVYKEPVKKTPVLPHYRSCPVAVEKRKGGTNVPRRWTGTGPVESKEGYGVGTKEAKNRNGGIGEDLNQNDILVIKHPVVKPFLLFVYNKFKCCLHVSYKYSVR